MTSILTHSWIVNPWHSRQILLWIGLYTQILLSVSCHSERIIYLPEAQDRLGLFLDKVKSIFLSYFFKDLQ